MKWDEPVWVQAKVMLSPCLTKHNNMKAYSGVEAEILPFIISVTRWR
jgi:hypothetical protein